MVKGESHIPKLRFKGFSDEWNKCIIDDFIFLRNDIEDPKKYSVDIELENLVSNKGIVVGDTSIRTQSNSTFKIGDILFGRLRPYLNKWWLSNTNGVKSGEIWALFPKNDNPNTFIYSVVQTPKFLTYVNLTSGTKMPRADWSVVKEQSYYIPNILEQTQIGNFFQKIDQVIELQQKALDTARDYKKSMLQKMFPQKGEKVPQIRFDGFSGDWEEKKLGEHTEYITKGTTPKIQLEHGNINFIKVENINNGKIFPVVKISEDEHFGYLKRSQLKENDILFSIAGTLGRIAVVTKNILPANTNQALAIIREYAFDRLFLIAVLIGRVVADYVRQNPTIGAQPNLSLEQIKSLSFMCPQVEEQQKIGEFFQKLDQQIEQHEKKLQSYQNLKKAMLQRLFV